MNLRKLAKGRECQVRLPGICNFNNETTVLAHIRMAGMTGVGMKAPDLFGAWCCSNCHDEIDRRTYNISPTESKLAHLEGMLRTQAILIKEGILKW